MLVRVILHLHWDFIDRWRNLQDDIILIDNLLYLHLWGFVLKLDWGVELFAYGSILIIRLSLYLWKLRLVLGHIVGGCIKLRSIDNDRLLFLDDPLVGSLLSLLRDTLGKIEFVLVGQKTSIVTMWWLVHASWRDIKWLECSIDDDLPCWLSRIVICGLIVRIV